jgi:hypothetical protein
MGGLTQGAQDVRSHNVCRPCAMAGLQALFARVPSDQGRQQCVGQQMSANPAGDDAKAPMKGLLITFRQAHLK